MEDGRQVAVADGLGWLLGDEGSGFWIGQRVVRAALADLDGRGPATALTPLMLARLGVPAPSDAGDREPIMAVVRALYAGPPVRLADYAGLVFEVDGDATADRILDDAAAALARTLAAVRSPTVSGPVVLGGGILGRGRQLADRLAAACGADEVHAVADGAVGVCVLALRHAGTARRRGRVPTGDDLTRRGALIRSVLRRTQLVEPDLPCGFCGLERVAEALRREATQLGLVENGSGQLGLVQARGWAVVDAVGPVCEPVVHEHDPALQRRLSDGREVLVERLGAPVVAVDGPEHGCEARRDHRLPGWAVLGAVRRAEPLDWDAGEIFQLRSGRPSRAR